ncbi:MAG: FeoA family protein [Clostridia bacterium]|nr:FeoA family protein [Clostridia bacterium]
MVLGSIRRRLLDLGLVQGAIVTSILKSPSGGITAFNFCGTLIAIRDEDSSLIEISY